MLITVARSSRSVSRCRGSAIPAAAFVFVTVVLRVLGSRWPAALAIGVARAPAGSYYLFAVLLDVPLPARPVVS